MVKLQITLESQEADALAEWAASELRDPREQVRYILRRDLAQRGLVTKSTVRQDTGKTTSLASAVQPQREVQP